MKLLKHLTILVIHILSNSWKRETKKRKRSDMIGKKEAQTILKKRKRQRNRVAKRYRN